MGRASQRVDLGIDATALSDALERSEVYVHYQPKADIRTGIVRGVEALARWKHPVMGQVPPDQFIPVAERSQLIHRLTIDVMNQAMLQSSRGAPAVCICRWRSICRRRCSSAPISRWK